jgi:hypothetical protein
VADSGAQCLGASFFGCKPGSKTFRGIALAQAIGLLTGGVNAVEEAAPIAVNRLLYAPDFCQIDSGSNDHAVYQAKSFTFFAMGLMR